MVEFLIHEYEAFLGRSRLVTGFQFHAFPKRSDAGPFRKLLASHPRRLHTTSGVVAEIQGHLYSAEPSGGGEPRRVFWGQFWKFLCDEFRRMGVKEHLVQVIEIPQTLLAEFGAVDGALIELAGRLTKPGERAVIVTGDSEFFGNGCCAQQIHARLFGKRQDRFPPGS